MMKENEHIKIQGICGGGFWLRYVRNNRVYAEEFIHANCVSLGAVYFQNKIEDLINAGRLKTEKHDRFEGSLIAYKNINGKATGFPIFDLETHIEHFYPDDGDVEPDAPTKLIYSVQNKFHAIAALFESAISDLNQLAEEHFDDNGKELAAAVARGLGKVAEDFDDRVTEVPCGEWTAESLSSILYRLTHNHHQVLVIPELRRSYFEDLNFAEDETPEESYAEIKRWIDDIRNQFNLSLNWK